MIFIIVYYAECLALIIYTARTKLSQLYAHLFYTELEMRLYCAKTS